MSKVNLARRLFLGRAAVGAAVAPALAATLPGVGGMGTAYGAAALNRAMNNCGGLVSAPLAPSRDPIMDRLYKAFHDAERKQYALCRVRDRQRAIFGGFDPDIAALVSVSPATKMRMQAERQAREDEENSTWGERTRKALGLPT